MEQIPMFKLASTTCSICGCKLTDPNSVERGIGPICANSNLSHTETATRTRQIADHYIAIPIKHNGLILRRDENGVSTNVPHLIIEHSPTGYEFGYGGSGPADLALNVVEVLLRHIGYEGPRMPCLDGSCFQMAWSMHHDFKWRFLCAVQRSGATIPYADMIDWVKGGLQ